MPLIVGELLRDLVVEMKILGRRHLASQRTSDEDMRVGSKPKAQILVSVRILNPQHRRKCSKGRVGMAGKNSLARDQARSAEPAEH